MTKTALQLKDEGNKALGEQKFKEAVECYTKAIELDPTNHVLYSNRSAAYAKMDKYKESLEDADKTVSLSPQWPKGYSRKGTSLSFLNRYPEAIAAFEKGLELDPKNKQIQDGLEEVRNKMNGPSNDSRREFSPFGDPNLLAKLAMDPRTKDFLSDPSYIKMVQELGKNPQNMSNHMQDPRMMTTLSVLLGLNISNMNTDADDESPEEPQPPKPKSPKEEPKKTKVEKMDVDLSDEQQQALNAKELGNAAYKNKKFDEALEHYNKAIELDPSNIMLLNNKAAVYYEMKEFEECIKICEKAVDVGRDNRADFKLIAKSFTRIGNAYKSQKNYAQAKKYYQKSLSEHRTTEMRETLSKVEKLLKEQEKSAYLNPELAEEERQKGNESFKKGDYPTAIKHYTEGIMRNPTDSKIYSNRAACYTKLAEFNLGLKDCEECIKLDPAFIKGYIRKGKILQGTKQYAKAQDAYQKALDVDSTNNEAMDGIRECMLIGSNDPEEVRKRAMDDPEVQQILKDPAMRMILEQMQSDPKALSEHLKNPEVANKIQKLMQSGLISIR